MSAGQRGLLEFAKSYCSLVYIAVYHFRGNEILMPDNVFTVKIPKFNILGSHKEEFLSFAETIGIPNDIQYEQSRFVIVTDKTKTINFAEKLVAFPYYKGFDKSEINCKKIMTYAVDENSADVVGKNVRYKSDFTAFELLTGSGIGRVYIDGTEKNYPKYALALACGIMLSGIDFKTAVDIVSNPK